MIYNFAILIYLLSYVFVVAFAVKEIFEFKRVYPVQLSVSLLVAMLPLVNSLVVVFLIREYLEKNPLKLLSKIRLLYK